MSPLAMLAVQALLVQSLILILFRLRLTLGLVPLRMLGCISKPSDDYSNLSCRSRFKHISQSRVDHSFRRQPLYGAADLH